MPARQGKTHNSIRFDYGSADYYSYYINNYKNKSNLSQGEYGKILFDFFGKIVDAIIYEGFDYTIPYGLGKIYLSKYKPKVVIEDGKIKSKIPIDWDATLKLWENDKEAKENKILVKHNNKHTKGYVFLLYYEKAHAKYKNKYFYRAIFTRTNKLKLKEAIKEYQIDALEKKYEQKC